SRTLGADRDAKAWSTDDEHCDIEVAARTVTLGPNATALLVTELRGFEYRYRSHALYLPRNGALATLWRDDADTFGIHATTTTVIAGGPEGQDVAFIDVKRDFTALVRKVSATRLHFDSGKRQIDLHPLPDAPASLFGVRSGNSKSPHDGWISRSPCLEELMPMQGRLFPGLHLPPFFLGDIYARRDDADAARVELATCSEA